MIQDSLISLSKFILETIRAFVRFEKKSILKNFKVFLVFRNKGLRIFRSWNFFVVELLFLSFSKNILQFFSYICGINRKYVCLVIIIVDSNDCQIQSSGNFE